MEIFWVKDDRGEILDYEIFCFFTSLTPYQLVFNSFWPFLYFRLEQFSNNKTTKKVPKGGYNSSQYLTCLVLSAERP